MPLLLHRHQAEDVYKRQAMLAKDKQLIATAADSLRELALGGTAVGTGLNAHERFGELSAQKISEITGEKFVTCLLYTSRCV